MTLPTTELLRIVQARMPGASLCLTEQDASALRGTQADLGMFFRTGADLCARAGHGYRIPVVREPRFVLATSEQRNALAVWDRKTPVDWVVVATGLVDWLVELGQEVARDLARLPAGHPRLVPYAGLIQTLQADDGVEVFGLALAQMSFIFIVGHELGHHHCGHDFFYPPSQANACVDEARATAPPGRSRRARTPREIDWDQPELESQARELAADHLGVATLVQHMRRLERRRSAGTLALSGNPPAATQLLQALLANQPTRALGTSGAVLMAFVALGAKRWEPRHLAYSSHPYAAVRCVAMVQVLRSLEPDAAGDDPWGPLTLFAMPLAARVSGVRASPRTPATARRAAMQAWRRLGINDAMFRPLVLQAYLARLKQLWAGQRRACKPAWRVREPVPLA